MQPTSRPPQLILTGGTLSASRNADGFLSPSADSLNAALERVGFNVQTAVKPYKSVEPDEVIDSINFDIGKHYPLLFKAVSDSLDAGNTPVVCGGTDTLEWYSTLLTKDLMLHGKLQPGSNQKVIFLTSMYPIDKKSDEKDSVNGAEHVENILRAGKLMAEQPLSGGFAVCAENEKGDKLVVHDVLNHFHKISSSLLYAFRSKASIGNIADNVFLSNEHYQQSLIPAKIDPQEKGGRAHIAPPLLRGHRGEAILRYLEEIERTDPPFDGALIEYGAADGDHHKKLLTTAVRILKERGMRVVVCIPMRFYGRDSSNMAGKEVPFNHANCTLRPMDMDKDEKEFRAELESAGAECVTALPKDAYLDMMLTTPHRPHVLRQKLAPFGGPKTLPVLGIRYVPDLKLTEQCIKVFAPRTKHLAFSALPNNVLPDTLLPTLQSYQDKTTFHATFEYNGLEHEGSDGKRFVEGTGTNEYAAGRGTGSLIKGYGSGSRHIVQEFDAHAKHKNGRPVHIPGGSPGRSDIKRSDHKRIRREERDSRNL